MQNAFSLSWEVLFMPAAAFHGVIWEEENAFSCLSPPHVFLQEEEKEEKECFCSSCGVRAGSV